MIFIYNSKEYAGANAVEIMREMARDAGWCSPHGGTIRDFLRRALVDLADRVHMRELDIGRHLSEEMIAFDYLCLLDEYGIGHLSVSPPDAPPHPGPGINPT